jgi:hypothetical protein
MPLALADPQVDKIYNVIKLLRPGVSLACAESKYTEQAQPLSMSMGNYERIVIIGETGGEY